MNAPRDEMKLSVEFPGDIGDCSEWLMSTFTTVRFASCSSRRKRETRIAVMLKVDGTYERRARVASEIVTYGLVKEVR